MELKMMEEKKIQLIHLVYAEDRKRTVAEIASEMELSSATVSRWRWRICLEVYRDLVRYKMGFPDGVSEEELQKKYQITKDQFKRMTTDAEDWYKDRIDAWSEVTGSKRRVIEWPI